MGAVIRVNQAITVCTAHATCQCTDWARQVAQAHLIFPHTVFTPDRQGGEGALLRPFHAITDNVVVGGVGLQAGHQDVVDHWGQVAAVGIRHNWMTGQVQGRELILAAQS